jgi:hypothetical protein
MQLPNRLILFAVRFRQRGWLHRTSDHLPPGAGGSMHSTMLLRSAASLKDMMVPYGVFWAFTGQNAVDVTLEALR